MFPTGVKNFEAGGEQGEKFAQAPATDIGGVLRKLQIYMIQLEALAWAAELIEHKAYHRTLPVVGGWGLGENQQFH